MARTHRYSEAQIRIALINNNGLLTGAAKDLGCTYITIYNYIKKSKRLQVVLDELKNKVIDIAENHIFLAIQEGDLSTIKWYLKYKGKERGYASIIDLNVDTHSSELSPVPQTDEQIAKYQDFIRTLRDK